MNGASTSSMKKGGGCFYIGGTNMSNNVIPFKKSIVAKPQPWIGAVFYCMKCNGDEFKLFQSGTVNCVKCGSKMGNLTISASYLPEAK